MQKSDELLLDLKCWLESGGKKLLEESFARAEAAAKTMREALRPDPETLRQPMTL